MEHADHVALLRAGVEGAAAGERWADVGAGTGAFTLALADLLGPGSAVIAIDRDAAALEANGAAMAARFPDVRFEPIVADITGPLDLVGLDGIVAANSLHFVGLERQVETVRRLATMLRPDGSSSSSSTTPIGATHGSRTRSASRRGGGSLSRPACATPNGSGESRAAGSARSTPPPAGGRRRCRAIPSRAARRSDRRAGSSA